MNIRLAAAAFLTPLGFAAPTLADLQYADFTSVDGLLLNGWASQAGDRLRLTPDAPDRFGSAWYAVKQYVAAGFETEFVFELDAGISKGGLAFVVQDATGTAIGGSSCRLGYHGVPNSVAIELDAFGDGDCESFTIGDPAGHHVSVHTLGTAPNSMEETASIGLSSAVPDFTGGAAHVVRVEYDPGTLRVFVDDLVTPVLTVPLDLDAVLALDSGHAWVGLTAGTGGPPEPNDVLSWSFTEGMATSGNNPPAAPVITEPELQGQIVNPSDVHMESSAFSDPDAGDLHLCTDWEIWTLVPNERIWSTTCVGGVERVHSHLGDGVFENSHAGRIELIAFTPYVLRTRHRDDSGDPGTEWSAWSIRSFATANSADIFPLEIEDVVDVPEPAWVFADGSGRVVLPVGGSSVRLETESSELLLQLSAFDGVTNTVQNPPRLGDHSPARVIASAGPQPLFLAASDLKFVDDDCAAYSVLLPPLQLAANETAVFWVASTGVTYLGTPADTMPTFDDIARGYSPPWITLQPGYAVELVATGFELPVNVALVPDPGTQPDSPKFYVSELYGAIKVVTNDGTVSTYADGLLNYNPTGNFPGSGEQGLAGLAVHAATGDLYVSMLYAPVANPSVHFPKVVRFTSADGGLTASTQSTILDMPGEPQGQSHFISNLTIHPNESLFVHMGDGFASGTSQNLNSFRGKILRLELDGGPHPQNPFYDPNDGISARDFIYAYGVRNPFGGTRRASDGLQYVVENGPNVDRFAKVERGFNYGWDGTTASMYTHAKYNWLPAHAPTNIAFVEPETFGGSGFPAIKQGHAFVAESGPTYAQGPQDRGKRISELVLDPDGNVLLGPVPFLEYAGTGRASLIGLAAGPEGLYFTDLYKDQGASPTDPGANVYVVRFTGKSDCNANGVHDSCEIASGAVTDSDGNGVPDGCQCVGTNYCSPTANSTGSPAIITGDGSCAIAQQGFLLSATPVPDQFGVFFYGADMVSVPFANGFRCAGGPQIFRLPIVLASGGIAFHPVDFTDPPNPSGQITPGSTWNFQYWFRDPAGGGAFVNLSDATTVTFE